MARFVGATFGFAAALRTFGTRYGGGATYHAIVDRESSPKAKNDVSALEGYVWPLCAAVALFTPLCHYLHSSLLLYGEEDENVHIGPYLSLRSGVHFGPLLVISPHERATLWWWTLEERMTFPPPAAFTLYRSFTRKSAPPVVNGLLYRRN